MKNDKSINYYLDFLIPQYQEDLPLELLGF